MSSLRIFFVIVMTMMVTAALAQDQIIEGSSPNLYLNHQVGAKETWYSIGRLYNLSPKDLAAYNKLSIDKPLEIGQQITIPLTAANFSQDDQTGTMPALVPVYHVVQPKEWLYRISVNYNKVPTERLQKWNSIGKDGAKPGTKLIVGYLKLKGANSAATASTAASAAPAAKLPASTPKPDSQKAAAAATTQPSSGTVTGAQASGAAGVEGSYFKNQFEDGGRNAAGIAGIFKSTSGWSDGKYYALISNVPIGTIIKVTLPATTKSIYAKVLGELPDMKESEGLALRISDAAAHELGSPESKFTVSVKY